MEENKEEKNCPCCSGKHKERQEKEKKDLMNRLYLLFPCISDPVLKHPVDRTMRNIDYYIRICL